MYASLHQNLLNVVTIPSTTSTNAPLILSFGALGSLHGSVEEYTPGNLVEFLGQIDSLFTKHPISC